MVVFGMLAKNVIMNQELIRFFGGKKSLKIKNVEK